MWPEQNEKCTKKWVQTEKKLSDFGEYHSAVKENICVPIVKCDGSVDL